MKRIKLILFWRNCLLCSFFTFTAQKLVYNANCSFIVNIVLFLLLILILTKNNIVVFHLEIIYSSDAKY